MQILRWSEQAGGLRPEAESGEPPLRVADSFLLDDGRLIGAGLHRARFLASAGAPAAPDFHAAAMASLPRDGRWFPRLEESAEGVLRVRVRPAPTLRDTVRIWTSPIDPRDVPAIKGPDLAALAVLRRHALEAGAEEAVILDRGVLSEGAGTALLWWREGILHIPPPELPRVASVLARTLVAMAATAGVQVREEGAPPKALSGVELWAVNALHGIRVVSEWVGGPVLTSEPGRAEHWRIQLASQARALPD